MTNGTRIIGFGNPDRGDDAAGLLVARRLRELGLASEEGGDALSLIESWRYAPDVTIIDTVVTGAPPGTIKLWEVGQDRGSDFDQSVTSTHSLGIAQAIELSRTLNCLPRRIQIYGIEGKSFEIGAPPSTGILAAVESLAQQLARAHSRGFEPES